MITLKEANKVRTSLKMKLSNFSWYKESYIIPNASNYIVVIHVPQVNNNVRKIISPIIDGVEIKIESDN